MLRHSLRLQLTVALVATIVCALALNGLGLMLYDSTTSKAALVQEIEAVALVVGENSAAALTFDDPRFVKTTLASLRPRADLRVAALYRTDGQLFAELRGEGGPSAPASVPTAGVAETSDAIRVVRQVCLLDGCVGSILVEIDMRRLHARRRDTLNIFLAVFVVSLALAYAIGAALQRPLVTPLRQLSVAADEVMRTERFDMRLPERATDDEVGVLVRAFNGMLAHLAARDRALQRHHDDLEQTVAQRTVELRVAKDRAESANRFKSQFVTTLSHEIRTPMTGVLGMTELALDTNLTLSQREYLQTIRRSSEALITVMDDVMDLSRIEAGRIDLEDVTFDLASVVHDALGAVAIRAHQKDLDLVWDQDVPLPAMVSADPARLRQVLNNLLGNAVKFTNVGFVRVHVDITPIDEAGRAMLRVHVADSGVGIAPSQLDVIGKMLQEAGTGTPQLFEGNGLGLPICGRLLHLMGGSLTVTSDEGAGTLVSVGVPVTIREAVTAAVEARPQELAGRDVLLVERQAASRAVLANWLTAWGANVTCPDLGDQDALIALLQNHRWGLVLIDGESLEAAIPDPAAFARAGVPVVDLALTIDGPSAASPSLLPRLAKPLRRPTAAAVLAAALNRVARAVATAPPAPLALVSRAVPVPRVLAVDDNELNLRVVRELLEHRGCEVIVAKTGSAAVEAWHRERFDLVLMDVQMPGLDGLQACKEIREVEERRRVRRRTPIVAITAHAMAGDRERCLAAGMDDYLPKPVRQAALYAMLETLGIAPEGLEKPA